MKIMVIYNDTSGKNEGEQIANNFKNFVKNNKDVEKIIFQVTNPDVDEKKILQSAKDHQIDTLIVIGGDGTVHHVVRMFQETIDQYQVGLIPGGTINNLARVLAIPLEQDEAFNVIVNQHTRKIDYAKVNDDVMISTMTVGILADTASKVSQEEKQKYGPLAFTKRFFRILFKRRKYPLSIQTEDDFWQGKAHLVTITMTNSVGGFTQFDASATPDDGQMHVTIIPKLQFFRFIYNIPRIFKGEFHKIPGVTYFSAKEAILTPLTDEKKIVTRTDGDPTDDLPVQLQAIHQKLAVFTPATK
jgi:YegS/Rv2252/BmrU family lipid kinase